jgi:hypothetical protein
MVSKLFERSNPELDNIQIEWAFLGVEVPNA